MKLIDKLKEIVEKECAGDDPDLELYNIIQQAMESIGKDEDGEEEDLDAENFEVLSFEVLSMDEDSIKISYWQEPLTYTLKWNGSHLVLDKNPIYEGFKCGMDAEEFYQKIGKLDSYNEYY